MARHLTVSRLIDLLEELRAYHGDDARVLTMSQEGWPIRVSLPHDRRLSATPAAMIRLRTPAQRRIRR